MNREIKSEVISRRSALSLLGMAALGLAVPTTVLTVSDAEAQQPAAPTVHPGSSKRLKHGPAFDRLGRR